VRRSWLSLDTCMSCLGSVSSFEVLSCLMSHEHVLTVSLSCIVKCLFCTETLAFLAESWPLDHYSLFTSVTIVLVVVVVYSYRPALMCVDYCTLAISQTETFYQRLNPIFNVLARFMSCYLCLAMSHVSSI